MKDRRWRNGLLLLLCVAAGAGVFLWWLSPAVAHHVLAASVGAWCS